MLIVVVLNAFLVEGSNRSTNGDKANHTDGRTCVGISLANFLRGVLLLGQVDHGSLNDFVVLARLGEEVSLLVKAGFPGEDLWRCLAHAGLEVVVEGHLLGQVNGHVLELDEVDHRRTFTVVPLVPDTLDLAASFFSQRV